MAMKSHRFTAFLDQVGLDDLRQAGGKAANLGCLLRAGFPVPAGFCVLSRAWEHFLQTTGLEERLAAALRDISFHNLEEVEKRASWLRETIISTPFPGAIEREIALAYQRLTSNSDGQELVAVRSSAVSIDLTVTSFPGQMETFHNVRGEEAMLEKVRECWASLFSYAALVNRHVKGMDHFGVSIAPLLQLMVPSQSAGVIFTADPITGSRDRMAINSCFGLGQAVASGILDCDHFVVDGKSAEVSEERLGDKSFRIGLDTERGEGCISIPLSPDKRREPSLSVDQIRELVEMARAIEASYERPQDIEWAFSGGKLHILQSRNLITAAADHKPPHDEAEWVCEFDSAVDPRYPQYTLSNISEVLPGVLTPLSISDIDSLDYGFVKCNSDLGLMKGIHTDSEYTFLGIFYGRAHLNLSVYKAVISKIPGATTKEFDRRPSSQIEEGETEAWSFTIGNIAALPGIFARMIRSVYLIPKKAKSMGGSYRDMLFKARGYDYEEMPFQEVFAILEEFRHNLFGVMALHICASQFAVIYYDMLAKITARWLEGSEGMMAARLVTGLRDMESAIPSVPIWDLSRMVRDSAPLTKIFADNRPEKIWDALQDNPSPHTMAFLRSLRSFLDRFGYRGIFEAEAMLPNWEQDPGYIFAIIGNFLDADPGMSPRETMMRQERERQRAVEEALRKLRGPRRLLLRYLVRQAQTYISLREFVKALIVEGLAHAKMVFRVVGRRLTEEGMVCEPQDIYFLTHREIEALATGRGKSLPVGDLVPRRRMEYERNLTVILPEYSRGRPKPLGSGEPETREDVEMLDGIGVSPGRVTGRARVITDPLGDARIKPGEILVAPVTDAAWTPLFVTAGATVVDIGGPLSHGSIVAREFGLPCVVNVSKATSLIRDGQIISVDGGQGRVYLHPLKEGQGGRGKI
jgi:phosphohistidine swiveling domain-containing protein